MSVGSQGSAGQNGAGDCFLLSVLGPAMLCGAEGPQSWLPWVLALALCRVASLYLAASSSES